MAVTMGDQRAQEIERFLTLYGWHEAERLPLAGDASARRYFRLQRDRDDRVILVDSPFPDLDVVPFIQVGQILRQMELSVPAILGEEAEDGLLLVEDFGDDTFSRLLGAKADPADLYALAVDVLVVLHKRFSPRLVNGFDLPVYDARRFIEQVMLFADAFMPAALGRSLTEVERRDLEAAWWTVVPDACEGAQSLMLRDFHVDNLMRLPRPGVRACGLLDFQGAGTGPIAYDLVSLIEDARRDVPAALGSEMVMRYCAAMPGLDRIAFRRSLDVLGAVRHARVIGIFSHIAAKQGRRGYLVHLPRVWRMLEARLDRPALAPVKAWFDRMVPGDRRGSFVPFEP